MPKTVAKFELVLRNVENDEASVVGWGQRRAKNAHAIDIRLHPGIQLDSMGDGYEIELRPVR